MKYKFLPIILMFFMLYPAHAQFELRIKEKNQSQTEYALKAIRKITFQDGNLIVTQSDNNDVNFAIDGIQNLSFVENPDNVESPKLDTSSGLNLFPNPAKDYIHVTLTSKENFSDYALKVFNTNGQLIISKTFDEGGSAVLDVSMLPIGIYACQCYNNSNSVHIKKFVKH